MGNVLEDNLHEEPCVSCGEETAIGSLFYFDRHTVENPDGTRAYLCSACIARIRSAGYREDLNDLDRVVELVVRRNAKR